MNAKAATKEQDDLERQACDKINTQRKLLHKAIDEYAEDMIQICKERKDYNLSILQENSLSSKSTEITNIQSQFDKLLQSNHFSELFEASNTATPKDHEPSFYLKSIDFNVNAISKKSVGIVFGQMDDAETADNVNDYLDSNYLPAATSYLVTENRKSDAAASFLHSGKLKAVSTINNLKSDCASIIHSSSVGHSWIRWASQNEIQLTDREGNVSQTVKFSKEISGITTTPDNILLVCGWKKKCIYQVLYGREPTVCFKTTLHPYDICTTENGDMYVSVVDSDTFTITSDRRTMVNRYNGAGVQISSAEHDMFGDRLFVKPVKLCVNSANTTIAVVNKTSAISSHVVLLDISLSLILRYDGQVTKANKKYASSNTKRSIEDVTFIGSRILLADYKSRSILLLDSNCQLVKSLWTDDLPPISLCVHSTGELWCGLYRKGSGIIKVIKATDSDETTETALTRTNKLLSSDGTSNSMLKQAKQLAETTSELVRTFREESKTSIDTNTKKRLLSSAKELTDATVHTVKAAKDYANDPDNSAQKQALKTAIADLKSAINAATNVVD